RRQHAVRIEVLGEPGVADRLADAGGDGLQEEETVVGEDTADDLHEAPVVLPADVLEHAHRDHAVEGPELAEPLVAVVVEPDVDRQLGVDALRVDVLLLGDGDADDADAVILGGVAGQGPEAAADVEKLVALLELELLADEVELGALRL